VKEGGKGCVHLNDLVHASYSLSTSKLRALFVTRFVTYQMRVTMQSKYRPLTMLACMFLFVGWTFPPQSTELPTYGTIEQIKNHRRVYLGSENEDSRKRIIKALGKDQNLEVVNSPDEAQFFIEYTELSREAVVTGSRTKERQQRSQMLAYVFGPDKRKIIVWSDNRSRETENFLGMKMYDSGRNESELTNKFLKALKKARVDKK
jgi:hypothetical protein